MILSKDKPFSSLIQGAVMDSPLARLLPDTATVSPDGILQISGHSVKNLAEKFGTPIYVRFVLIDDKKRER
jgi:hypothetical protein